MARRGARGRSAPFCAVRTKRPIAVSASAARQSGRARKRSARGWASFGGFRTNGAGGGSRRARRRFAASGQRGRAQVGVGDAGRGHGCRCALCGQTGGPVVAGLLQLPDERAVAVRASAARRCAAVSRSSDKGGGRERERRRRGAAVRVSDVEGGRRWGCGGAGCWGRLPLCAFRTNARRGGFRRFAAFGQKESGRRLACRRRHGDARGSGALRTNARAGDLCRSAAFGRTARRRGGAARGMETPGRGCSLLDGSGRAVPVRPRRAGDRRGRSGGSAGRRRGGTRRAGQGRGASGHRRAA